MQLLKNNTKILQTNNITQQQIKYYDKWRNKKTNKITSLFNLSSTVPLIKQRNYIDNKVHIEH